MKDAFEFLKELGYLDSPANRFFWKNATPTLRNHLRQFCMVSPLAALPISMFAAGLTTLTGTDRLWLFLFYFVLVSLCFLMADLLTGLLVRMRLLRTFWAESRLPNIIPLPVSVVFLLISGGLFLDAIMVKPLFSRLLIWTALGLSSWIAAWSVRLLLTSRLCWQGIRPPEYRPYRPLMALTAAAIIGFYFHQSRARVSPPVRALEKVPPMLVLNLDVPQHLFDAYADLFPAWPRQHLQVEESDITHFWTSFGTGAPVRGHQASLLTWQTPLFAANLSDQDPTALLALRLFQGIGMAEPLAEGERSRKYFWEILDEYDLRTYSFSFWHSFPASSQNGGVLSERWTEQRLGAPYLSGLSRSLRARLLPLTAIPPYNLPSNEKIRPGHN